MITLTVTSDSTPSELELGLKFLREIYEVKVGVKIVDAIDANDQTNRERFSKSELAEAATFNATELAEAEALGKPVCSTVDAEVSQTAHVDTTANTSIPTPQSVFGQSAQTVVSEVNPVAPAMEPPATDADGLVWDERIHSSSKEFNKDGTWRKRRGVDAQLVTTVETELRGAPKPPVDHSHEGETPVFTATIPTEMTFPELLDGVTKAMVAGQLTQARITEALKSIGIEALSHLIARTDLIPAFREALGGVV